MPLIPIVSVKMFLKNKGESLINIALPQKLAVVSVFDRMRVSPCYTYPLIKNVTFGTSRQFQKSIPESKVEHTLFTSAGMMRSMVLQTQGVYLIKWLIISCMG